MKRLLDYINRTDPEFKTICLKYLEEFEKPLHSHPGRQRGLNGLAIHTVQVIEKALEWNQGFDCREIIETCLAHDLKNWREFKLQSNQVTAIRATKGLRWEVWRKTPYYRFVVLILIADMWSAYLNIEDKK